MEKTINIKFDEEQLEDIVNRVTENIMKEAKKESNTKEINDKSKQKWSLMYLEANETHSESMKEKIYFGYAYNTLSKEYASELSSLYKIDRKKIEELKEKGWKEEVFYK